MLTAIEHVGTWLHKRRPLWLFLCECGKTKVLRVENVVRTNSPTISCGCLLDGLLKGTMSIARAVWKENYADGDLTLETFMWFASQPCHYCGVFNSNTRNYRGKGPVESYKFNGCDRIDHTQPHNEDNIVTSCWPCNKSRGNESFSSYIERLQRISNNLFKEEHENINY